MTAATVEDHEEPDTVTLPLAYEEERGKPMPSNNHGAVQMNLGGEFLKHREFRVISELSLLLGERDFVPDLSIYRREPLDLRHDQVRRTDPPLVAVEIYSPTQGSLEIMEKVDAYLAAGVLSVWVVSPPIRNVTIFTPDGREHPFSAGVATDPAIGVTADLAVVFS